MYWILYKNDGVQLYSKISKLFIKNGCWFLSNTLSSYTDIIIYIYMHVCVYKFLLKLVSLMNYSGLFLQFQKTLPSGMISACLSCAIILIYFRFNLLKFYLEFLHITLWRKLTIFGIFIYFGYLDNAGLMEYERNNSLLFNFLREYIYICVCVCVYFFLTYLVDFTTEVLWVESFLSGTDFKHKVNFFIRNRTTLVVFFFLRLICVFQELYSFQNCQYIRIKFLVLFSYNPFYINWIWCWPLLFLLATCVFSLFTDQVGYRFIHLLIF